MAAAHNSISPINAPSAIPHLLAAAQRCLVRLLPAATLSGRECFLSHLSRAVTPPLQAGRPARQRELALYTSLLVLRGMEKCLGQELCAGLGDCR